MAKFSKENNDTAVAATERQMVNTQELLEQDIILMNQAKMERLEGYEKVGRIYAGAKNKCFSNMCYLVTTFTMSKFPH